MKSSACSREVFRMHQRNVRLLWHINPYPSPQNAACCGTSIRIRPPQNAACCNTSIRIRPPQYPESVGQRLQNEVEVLLHSFRAARHVDDESLLSYA